jgi:hypothetical protein
MLAVYIGTVEDGSSHPTLPAASTASPSPMIDVLRFGSFRMMLAASVATRLPTEAGDLFVAVF